MYSFEWTRRDSQWNTAGMTGHGGSSKDMPVNDEIMAGHGGTFSYFNCKL